MNVSSRRQLMQLCLRAAAFRSAHRSLLRYIGLALFALLTLGPQTVGAQGVQTGTVRGTVVDAQMLPVPGVTVAATSPALQGQRLSVTDATGSYTLAALPPGDYEIKYELAGFGTVTQKTNVLVGGTIEQNVTLRAAGVSESVQVVAETPAPIATPTVSANFKHEEIDALATPRDIQGIATLAPGVTESSPNAGQLVINGAFAYDNVFMVNGVDINDNLFAQPQNLFIEDAIQETQVLTSGISAEYGRFSGGVINAVTKSGSNRFEGSYRLSFRNPSWTQETPYEVAHNVTYPNDLQHWHEATFGGPIVRDRLWFFTSGRLQEISSPVTLNQTGTQLQSLDTNHRGELKFTGTVAANHTLQFDFLNDPRERTNNSGLQSFVMEQASEVDRQNPNHYWVTNYKGIVRNTLIEAQISQRKFQFKNDGGTDTNPMTGSPIMANVCACVYHAPYFDATDPESRNNYQGTANLTKFWSKGGRHDTKVGYEFFRSQRIGGNSQSPTNYVFNSDYLMDASGKPVLDSNNMVIPVFVPGVSQLWYFYPTRNATMNVNTNSAFAQDHWAVNRKLSADLGVRFEQVKIDSTGGITSVNTSPRFVPRLGLSYDIKGDGNHVAHVTYAQYSGRYSENYVGNSPVGKPAEIDVTYIGPAGVGNNFAPGFNAANYPITPTSWTYINVPLANVTQNDKLKSPLTNEFTASYGLNIKSGRGYAEAAYVYRSMSNIIEDFITRQTGVANVTLQGVNAGQATNINYDNSDIPWRRYQGMVFSGRYRIISHWSGNANYTLQLENDGNFEGEGTNTPASRSAADDFPEAIPANRYYPDGHLANFQRHRLRAWTVYDLDMHRAGSVSLSGLWRVDSARTYSLIVRNVTANATQRGIISAAGYPEQSFGPYNVYYSDRGSEQFKGYGLFDTSMQYNVPVFKSARPWIRFDVYNLFNNQKLIAWSTAITANNSGPKDQYGIPTTYNKSSTFGTATGNTITNGSLTNIPAYPQWVGGTNGGRTFRAALGIRF
jgi:hypothetical protein